MDLQKLLDYVEENARDVSDLIKVADIRRIEHGDPWRDVLIHDLRQKYEAEVLEAQEEIIIVSSVKEVFRKIKERGGDAGRDWHPTPSRQDDPLHIYSVSMADGRQIEFDAPNKDLARKIWEDTF